MFNVEIPKFFVGKDMAAYFNDDVSKLASFKNNEYIEMEALEDFTTVCEKLENSLLDISMLLKQKIDFFNEKLNEHEENNNELRDINEKIVLQKVSKRKFGKLGIEDEYEGTIMSDLIGSFKY